MSSKNSSGPASLLKKADDCRNALYNSAKARKYRHNWLNCINLYKSLYSNYPKSEQAAWALYRAGRMYTGLYRNSLQEEDLNESIRLYQKLVNEYGDHRVADDAQYRIGEIYYTDKKDLTQAYVEFLKVDIKYPSGDMRAKARSMLDTLGSAITTKEKLIKKQENSSHTTALIPVKDIRHWSTPNYTRVVIDLEKPVKYVSDMLKEDPGLHKPKRLYVDLKNAYVRTDFDPSIPIKGGLLQRARAGQYTKDTVRVVLDINSIGGYKIFHLHDPFRIVMDVHGIEKTDEKVLTDVPTPEKKEEKSVADVPAVEKKDDKHEKGPVIKRRIPRRGIRKVPEPPKKISLAGQLGLSVRKIIIDPGHGGKDPGCFLNGNVQEKDIVLDLAKRLEKKIEGRLKCKAVLTRERDTFLSLEQRTAFANVNKGDLFISLHVNAYKHPSIHGLETYFLNMATDERAVMVAARENATSEKNISDLQTILNDLMLNTKINESSRLAHRIQKGMVFTLQSSYKGVKSLGVKQAPFYVLIGAQMPAILIEIGYITNPSEKKRILNKKYMETLTEGIVEGIESYMKSIEEVYKGG
ncbi:MAG: N-acetylmuramoyl-L-alanine amidase [Pseudomonadota bacterium]